MKLIALEIPDQRDQRVSWLDEQMTGENFHSLLSQLAAFSNKSTTPVPSLDEILGHSRKSFHQHGFSALTDDQIKLLLTHPSRLEELQLDIFASGQPFWMTRFNTLHPTSATDVDSQKLPVSISTASSTSEKKSQLGFFAALAASIMLLVGGGIFLANRYDVNKSTPIASSGWGWSATDADQNKLPPKQYMEHLAQGASAWFNKRPTNANEYETRLIQLTEGCQKLIDSPHPPLAPATREQLVRRCIEWKAKFDRQLAETRADPKNYTKPLAATDESIRNAIAVIQQMADELPDSA
jgi:hypothetical protein